MPFELTPKQNDAQKVLSGQATKIILFGGSRSGKTFLLIRNVIMRALKAPNSRHVIARFRFNHIKRSVVLDTFPKVMELAFPGIHVHIDKTDWFAQFDNGSQIFFAGLDDKERTEKILGMEFVTIYLNECSQIPQGSYDILQTRLAQLVDQITPGMPNRPMTPRIYLDCNPSSKAHWTYMMFIQHLDPETRKPLLDANDYASFQLNPKDNVKNLTEGYIKTLQSLSARLRKRFLEGEYADANPNQLFDEDDIEKWRLKEDFEEVLPDMVRIVVGVDPSGADDVDNAHNDAIGIVVGGLGVDGNAYLLEDATVKAGPAVWSNIAVTAYDRHEADIIVGEVNYGGAMVGRVIQTAPAGLGRRIPYKTVTATRGKVIRAEPFSALYEQGKVRHAGQFVELEGQLAAMSTHGYLGEGSPNNADAWIWVLTELFGGIINATRRLPKQGGAGGNRSGTSFMGD